MTEKPEPPREPAVPSEQEQVTPTLEPLLIPREQRPNRRNKQSKLTDFLVREPPKPAGCSDRARIGTDHLVFEENPKKDEMGDSDINEQNMEEEDGVTS